MPNWLNSVDCSNDGFSINRKLFVPKHVVWLFFKPPLNYFWHPITNTSLVGVYLLCAPSNCRTLKSKFLRTKHRIAYSSLALLQQVKYEWLRINRLGRQGQTMHPIRFVRLDQGDIINESGWDRNCFLRWQHSTTLEKSKDPYSAL